MRACRLAVAWLGLAAWALSWIAADALAQSGRQGQAPMSITAARQGMAGSMLSVDWRGTRPDGELAMAFARSGAAPAVIIADAVVPLGAGSVSLPLPGEAGHYALRLLRRDGSGQVSVLLEQMVQATAPSATLSGPARVRRGSPFPARGNGPNGSRDIVTLVEPQAEAGDKGEGSVFFPSESVEGMLEAPSRPGLYELRYVMVAPLTGAVVLARQPVKVE